MTEPAGAALGALLVGGGDGWEGVVDAGMDADVAEAGAGCDAEVAGDVVDDVAEL
ncbi:MAG: hypothetical protein JF587_02725 [Catenulisporales bacterium]|nr:hypothetical protein [Catenulisporales bacterium]